MSTIHTLRVPIDNIRSSRRLQNSMRHLTRVFRLQRNSIDRRFKCCSGPGLLSRGDLCWSRRALCWDWRYLCWNWRLRWCDGLGRTVRQRTSQSLRRSNILCGYSVRRRTTTERSWAGPLRNARCRIWGSCMRRAVRGIWTRIDLRW